MCNKYYYRYATEDDVDLIYNWANEKAVRENSFCSDKIQYEEHIEWYKRLLEDKEHNIQLILMCDDTPVGQCRLRVEGSRAEMGISVDKEYRGTGVGNAIMTCACDWVRENRPDIKTIIARIKPKNEASMKAVMNAGFHETYRNFEYDL